MKLVVEEKGSGEAKRVMVENFLKGNVLRTMDVALAEVGNAIWKQTHQRKTLTRAEGEDALEKSLRIFNTIEVDLTESAAREALRIAGDLSLPFYDALYVAAAQRRGCALATADRDLAGKASRIVEVIRV